MWSNTSWWWSKLFRISLIHEPIHLPLVLDLVHVSGIISARIVQVVLDRNVYLRLTELREPPCFVFVFFARAPLGKTLEPSLYLLIIKHLRASLLKIPEVDRREVFYGFVSTSLIVEVVRAAVLKRGNMFLEYI